MQYESLRGNNMKSVALSPSKMELVMNHRTSALRIARSLLRRWNTFLDLSEIQSISDMALCEAVRGFDETRGTRFVTYLFPFIKGALIAELKSCQRDSVSLSQVANGSSNAGEYGTDSNGGVGAIPEIAADESCSPEHQTYRQELRVLCNKALDSLQPLEREALIGVDIFDHKVAQLARRIGYSRPYLSSVRTRAIEKMQPFFEKMAA